MTAEQKAVQLQRVQEAEATAGYNAELGVGLAEDRPGDGGPAARQVGAASLEWADDPLDEEHVGPFFRRRAGVGSELLRTAATQEWERATTLRRRFAGDLGGAGGCTLDWSRARAIADELGGRATSPR